LCIFFFIKYHVVGKDIFTGVRYEEVLAPTHMVKVPDLIKKDYFLINIEDDGYATLFDEVTCDTRSDLKLKL
jgi:translation elongation factor P/translation initiation factor 5A